MTPERAYELARYQRPGVRLVVGPTEAREEAITPMAWWQMRQLPGDHSFWERDMRNRLGYVPHLLASITGRWIEALNAVSLSDDEWHHLQEATKTERDAAIDVAIQDLLTKLQVDT